jgi:hypothetical protein
VNPFVYFSIKLKNKNSIFRLAQERDSYLKNKRLHQEEMKSGLDNQVILFKNLDFYILILLK